MATVTFMALMALSEAAQLPFNLQEEGTKAYLKGLSGLNLYNNYDSWFSGSFFNPSFKYPEPFNNYPFSDYSSYIQSTFSLFGSSYQGLSGYPEYYPIDRISYASNYLSGFDNSYSLTGLGIYNTYSSGGNYGFFSPILTDFLSPISPLPNPFIFFDPFALLFSTSWVPPYLWSPPVVPLVEWPTPSPKKPKTTQSEPTKFFEVEYSHDTYLGCEHSGFYIDNKGNVYTFKKVTEAMMNAAPDSGNDEEVKLVKTIEPTVLAEEKKLIKSASIGTYSERLSNCCDLGEKIYSCYQFDPITDKDKEIELEVTGDWSYSNQSEAAKALVSWLKEIETDLPVPITVEELSKNPQEYLNKNIITEGDLVYEGDYFTDPKFYLKGGDYKIEVERWVWLVGPKLSSVTQTPCRPGGSCHMPVIITMRKYLGKYLILVGHLEQKESNYIFIVTTASILNSPLFVFTRNRVNNRDGGD